jgi:hypothetical protein
VAVGRTAAAAGDADDADDMRGDDVLTKLVKKTEDDSDMVGGKITA